MTVKSLIEVTLEEIARNYQPGTLPWMKASRPNEWEKMLTMEDKVNEMALGSDTEGLKVVLSEYQRLILGLVGEFKALREEKGQRGFRFK